MVDRALARAAFRARAVTLAVATTGSTSLSATATGYHRAAGSFVTDGFVRGMEVVPTGFPQTTPGVVTLVTASDLTILGGRTVAAAAGSRTLASGLPTLRAWENEQFDRTAGRPFVTEQFVPATNFRLTMPANGGLREERGQSVWQWYGLADIGTEALDKGANAMLALFDGASLVLSSGHVVTVMGTPVGPTAGQILPTGDGWSVCTIRIPWKVFTRATVAA